MGRRYYYKRLSVKELNEKYVKKNKLLRRFMDGHPHRNEEKIGYCWNNEHKGWLTIDLLERHGCLEKKCRHLQLYYEIEKTKDGLVLGKKIEPKKDSKKDPERTIAPKEGDVSDAV